MRERRRHVTREIGRRLRRHTADEVIEHLRRHGAMTDDDDQKTEYGEPLREYSVPGGPLPKQREPIKTPKRSEYPRGSDEDRQGNRGR